MRIVDEKAKRKQTPAPLTTLTGPNAQRWSFPNPLTVPPNTTNSTARVSVQPPAPQPMLLLPLVRSVHSGSPDRLRSSVESIVGGYGVLAEMQDADDVENK